MDGFGQRMGFWTEHLSMATMWGKLAGDPAKDFEGQGDNTVFTFIYEWLFWGHLFVCLFVLAITTMNTSRLESREPYELIVIFLIGIKVRSLAILFPTSGWRYCFQHHCLLSAFPFCPVFRPQSPADNIHQVPCLRSGSVLSTHGRRTPFLSWLWEESS